MYSIILFILLVALTSSIIISYYKTNELKKFILLIRNKLKEIERAQSKEKNKYLKGKTVKHNSYETHRKNSKRSKNSELTPEFFGKTVYKGQFIYFVGISFANKNIIKRYRIIDKKHIRLVNDDGKCIGKKLTLSKAANINLGNNNHGLNYWLSENGIPLNVLRKKYYKNK